MIAIRHLSMRLTAGGRRVTILDDVALSIPPKQMVAVMGPSGSGKSTLLGLIAGLDRPTEGTIVLDGIDITTLSESRMAKFRRMKIGYIFQSFHLIPTLTALENVLVPLELAGHAAARWWAAAALDRLDAVARDLELRAVRLETARQRGVPPYVIFHDATLREMARLRPTSIDALRAVARRVEELGA